MVGFERGEEMLRNASVAVSLVAAFLLLGACDGSATPRGVTSTADVSSTTSSTSTSTSTVPPPSTTSSSITTTTAAPIDWDFYDPAALPVVSLIDPGSEPRRVVEYTAQVGATGHQVIRQRISLSQSIDDIPTLSFASDVAVEIIQEVVAVDDVAATVMQTYGGYKIHSADPSLIGELEGTYSALEGATSYVLVAPSGAVLATSMSGIPGDQGDLAQAGGLAAVPFPSEPIGIDAVWQVDSTVAIQGTTFLQTTIVQLVDLTDEIAEVDMAVSQTLGPEGFVLPGIETLELSLGAEGTGTAMWDLMLQPALRGEATLVQILAATFDIGDEQASLHQRVETAVETIRGPLVDTDPRIEGAALPIMPFASAIDTSATGVPAPHVSGYDFDRHPVTVDPNDGRPKAIVFLAHWCPHCQDEVPRVQAWLDSTGGVPGVDIYSVATSIEASRPNYPPAAWLEGEGWTIPVIVDDTDNSILSAYGSGGFPYWVFLNSDGTVAVRTAGQLDITQLEDLLQSLD